MSGRRFAKPLLVAFAIYVGSMLLGGILGRIYLTLDRESYLDLSQKEIVDAYEDSLDAALVRMSSVVARMFGTSQSFEQSVLEGIIRKRFVDEINISDSNGVWIASTEDGVAGGNFRLRPQTAAYFSLLTNDEPCICQPFRPSVEHPEQRRKYIAVPFPDKSGILQFGYDQHNVEEDFDTCYHTFLCSKSDAGSRFYLALSKDGRILASGLPTSARTVSETGLDPTSFPKTSGETFRAKVFGLNCWCRTCLFGDIRFVTLVNNASYNRARVFWFSMLNIIACFVLCVVGVLHFNGEKRRRVVEELNREEAKRRQEDLDMAKTIQRSALPAVFPPYPRDLTVDLFAQMSPARDVGGDFYDFHYVGRERLCVLVADVSGKGVPAAMFMMKAKAVLRDLTTSVTDLGEAITLANDILCEGNDADMFVTCWVGVLDEASGVLRYVNAGHNPPYVTEAKTHRIRSLGEVSGMFLGGMTGQRYRAYETRLAPDDLLYLYTDGITEANNALGQMFGESRLEETLRGERGLGLARFMRGPLALPSPETVCRRVRGAVDGFAGRAAQFDDITQLALRYRGQPVTARLTVPATLDSVAKLNAFAEERLNAGNCGAEARSNLLVALDEMANNVASYSGATKMTLEIEIARNPSVARFRLVDDGTPWNPLDHIDPDVTLSADERAVGGLGILMVKRLMDDVSYVRRRECNVFAFRKMI